MRAPSLICSLNHSPKPSSSQLLAEQVMAEFKKLAVKTEVVRVADCNIRHGVEIDMGEGDQWPGQQESARPALYRRMGPSPPCWVCAVAVAESGAKDGHAVPCGFSGHRSRLQGYFVLPLLTEENRRDLQSA